MKIYGRDWEDDNNYDEYKTMNHDLIEVLLSFIICFGIVYIVMKLFG